jgi:CelD/BcsL family acetyltransferase involved in cellulose biosynthesis
LSHRFFRTLDFHAIVKSNIQILATVEEFAGIQAEWNDLIHDEPAGLMGLDATCTYEWFDSVRAAFPDAAHAQVVTLRQDGILAGLIPVVESGTRFAGPRLIVPDELHGGRSGFRLARPDPESLAQLLSALHLVAPHWRTFQLTVPIGSPSELLLRQVCSSRGFRLIQDEATKSVFIPLLDGPDQFQQKMGKDLRKRVRSTPRKLAELGEMEYQEFTTEDQADALLDAVLTVERQTWKHKAGTAITNVPSQELFYRMMFPRMMRSGMLYGLVILLNGKPVAYIFGLLFDGVFSSLKISQIETLSKLSLSHLVRYELIGRIRTRGARTLESTGNDDPYKIRWSSDHQFVSRSRFTVFNQTFAGRLAHSLESARRFVIQRTRPK